MPAGAHVDIRIGEAAADAPQRIGVNLELQDDADGSNLWDWLRDANVGIAREFHPDRSFRTRADGPWTAVADAAGYAALRRAALADPAAVAGWNGFDFTAHQPWLGVPDDIVRRLTDAGIAALLSPGCAAKTTGPLVRADGVVDHRAKASAYAYHLEFILHYGRRFGVRDYLLANEPELSANDYRLGEADAAFVAPFEGRIAAYIRPGPATPAGIAERTLPAIAAQHRVLVEAVRDAADDAGAILGWRPRIHGPASLRPEELFAAAAGLVDGFDYHHYTWDPQVLRQRWRRLAAIAGDAPIGISEMNLQSGPMRPEQALFIHGNALALAGLAMAAAGLPLDGGRLSHVVLYLFNHPCTQRNFKQLLYGSMDEVDWTGQDLLPMRRGPPPPPAAQQARHATPAYDAWAMLARAAGGRLHRVDAGDGLEALAVAHGATMRLWLLRRDAGAALTAAVAPPPGGGWWCQRVLDRVRRDEPVAAGAVDGPVRIAIPGESLVELVFLPAPPAAPARIEDAGAGPGSAQGLAVLQTTRLRAVLADGADASQLHLRWTSSDPEAVRVGQRGLVQRLRPTAAPTVVTATPCAGGPALTIRIPPGGTP